MRRWICAVLAAAMMAGPCARAEEIAPTQEPVMEAETTHALMEQMFRAAAGTTFEEEKAVRAAFDKETAEEQKALRQEELALNRQVTLVWLQEALRPEEEIDPNATVTPEPAATPAPTPQPTAAATPDPMATPEPPVWTIEDAYAQFQTTEQGRIYLTMLEELGGAGAAGSMEIMRTACGLWMDEIRQEELEEINEDYSFWLYCADTQIDYPVVHGEDNEYYLHRMFNGERNAAGTLFVDYRNLPDFQDPNTLIYGHHMRNNSMFGALNDYELEGYFEAHPYLLAVSGKEIAIVEIFAGYTTSEDDHCYDIAISDEEDMMNFVAEAQAKSNFEAAVNVLPGDRLATLSTCAYAFRDARYIAIGRLNSVWRAGRMQ